ncbi:MAG: hypothetical protein HY706_07555 [Candidatus Hydrogenedentes bacterium]|nr:hypothetical protein [Candidatus Hydrogenedentota bacterium]
MFSTRILLAVTVCIGAGSSVYAQDPPPPPPGENPGFAPPEGPVPRDMHKPFAPPGHEGWKDGDIKEMIEKLWMVRLTEQLGLNDEQTVLVIRRAKDHREQLRKLAEQRQQLLRELKESVRAGGPEADIQNKLEALAQHDRESVERRWRAFEATAEGLNATQRAKLYVFISEFDNDMRRLVQKARERMSGRMMRPQDGPMGFGQPGQPGMAPQPGAPMGPGQGPMPPQWQQRPRDFRPGSPQGEFHSQPGAGPQGPPPPPGPGNPPLGAGQPR